MLRFVLLLAVGCSYRTAFDDCAVTCRSPSECPSGLSCGDEGFCRVAGTSGSCANIIGDARGDDDAPASSRCIGTATACEMIGNATGCGNQTGCSYEAPSCTMTLDCTELLPSTECDGTPGCHTDVVAPYCKPIDNYCNGSTQPTCTEKQNCAFAGGCTGVARACSSRTTATECRAHAGCNWN